MSAINAALFSPTDTYARPAARFDDVERQRNSVEQSDAANETLSIEQRYRYSEKQSLQLELVTQEGDYVRIDIRSDFYQSGQLQGDADGLSLQQNQQENQFQRYIVQGDLNEQEKAALDQLLAKSADLAVDFFNGDVEQAFEQAVSLGFDSQQIAGFSLQINQQQQLQTYTEVQQLAPQPPQQLANDQVRQLGQFVEGLSDISRYAQSFAEPLALLTQLLEQLGVQSSGTHNAFNDLLEFVAAKA